MFNSKALLCLLSCSALTSCSTARVCCDVLSLSTPEAPQGTFLKSTSLHYLINYGVDSYDVVANYDVRFLPGNSSTNGCTAHIRGKYGELVKSDELIMTGTELGSDLGEYTQSTKSRLKYYITGVIDRPNTDEIRERDKRALSIHVEESYETDYVFK